MGILQKKCGTTAKKALAYRGKGGQHTDTAFLALRLGVVLYLPNPCPRFLRLERPFGIKKIVLRDSLQQSFVLVGALESRGCTALSFYSLSGGTSPRAGLSRTD